MNKAEYLREKLQAGNATPLDARNAVLESNLSSACKLTLLAILSHRTNDNAEPMVGLRRLASLASMKTDTVNRALDELQRRGVLNFVHAPRKATRYDLSNVATALLNLPPFSTANSVTDSVTNVTATVPNQDTDAVPPNGTDESKPPTPSVPNEGQICPNPGVSTVPNGDTREDSEEDLEEDGGNADHHSDNDQETLIPENFELRPKAVTECAEHYQVTEEVIREAVREFVTYWRVGGGSGKRRSYWQAICRNDLKTKHEKGKLKAIADKLERDAEDLKGSHLEEAKRVNEARAAEASRRGDAERKAKRELQLQAPVAAVPRGPEGVRQLLAVVGRST